MNNDLENAVLYALKYKGGFAWSTEQRELEAYCESHMPTVWEAFKARERAERTLKLELDAFGHEV